MNGGHDDIDGQIIKDFVAALRYKIPDSAVEKIVIRPSTVEVYIGDGVTTIPIDWDGHRVESALLGRISYSMSFTPSQQLELLESVIRSWPHNRIVRGKGRYLEIWSH